MWVMWVAQKNNIQPKLAKKEIQPWGMCSGLRAKCYEDIIMESPTVKHGCGTVLSCFGATYLGWGFNQGEGILFRSQSFLFSRL